jgi:hypothetical protein
MPTYKSEWKPEGLNEDFWREVMIGRTITNLTFNEKGISGLVLDNGETIFVTHPGSLGIRTDPSNIVDVSGTASGAAAAQLGK